MWNWGDMMVMLISAFGCLTLFISQVNEILERLPRLFAAWRKAVGSVRDQQCQIHDEPEGNSVSRPDDL
ncbi:hypothetical protein [Nocardiopsis suaedae]|uniref:Uncharacterized protein n=1 Tax=Nocardiopsis suaedae TaxID=3018444 RepID=A0ABT4TTJ6_9ACTN|nr:hypothetical protein [Nocardiopsis suaedae]MDA2808013.1 hypothetical protein [Nocardiopsis suaedae]